MTGPKLDDVPSAVAHAVAEALGDAYDCTRVWSAWRHGTMEPSDFHPVADDGDRVAEIALAAINAWEASKPQPAPVIDLKKIVPAEKKLPELYFAEYHENKGWNACRAKMLTLIDGQANNLNEQFGNPEELPPAIDLEKYAVAIQYAINGMREAGGSTNNAVARKLESLLAMIDGRARCATCGTTIKPHPMTGTICDCALQPTKGEGQANVRSSSEHSSALTHVAYRKLQGLQDEGFIVNGVAIFNPTTGRRGLVDYLGYVGWQTSEQPTKSEED